MKVYAISGLGADYRAFAKLGRLIDLEVISWIEPMPTESIADYGLRLSAKIDDSQPFVLIGLSFGGLIANEISRVKVPELLVLISSASQRSDLPWLYRMAGNTKLCNHLPGLRNIPNFVIENMFGTSNKSLLRQIIKDTDPEFEKWAVSQLCKWNGQLPECPWQAIHGSKDKILPNAPRENCSLLEGGHLVVLDRHTAVASLIQQAIADISTTQSHCT